MSTLRKSHADRSIEIVEGTLDLAAQPGGIARLSTQAIADHLGVSQSTIFKHFDSRVDLFSACYQHIGQIIFAELNPIFTLSAPADEKLRGFIAGHLDLVTRHRGIPRLIFSDQLHKENPTLKALAQQTTKKNATRILKLIEDGQTQGLFRQDVSAQDTCVFVVSAIQGAVLRWTLFDSDYDLTAYAPVLWAFIQPALSPPSSQ